ncbi:LamG domain-containing protein [Actinoplanes sp. CA-142083]|uniref:LamG domain-containing protein n=1 Tax=Actinoplanes sp. CA-142083 TaxID=3239903 RepID=UPI003D8E29A9
MAEAVPAPVMVKELSTPTRLVTAQPDGTLQAVLTVQPAGTDPTLERRADGRLAPREIGAELSFSPGGRGTPLVRFGAPGRSLALTWPGLLPAPVLAGGTATYREVLPGVDLVMRAEADGYVQHLVVKNAAAARSRALKRIRLGLATDGLRVEVTPSRRLEARDKAGKVVFAAAAPTMWDAAGTHAGVGVEAGATALTLIPDRRLLTGGTARFPITIDPDWRTFGQQGWTKVFSGKPDSAHWNGGNDLDNWAKVGYCDWPGCNGIGVARTYWTFDTSFLNGKRIISASLDATIAYGPQCRTDEHKLFATGGIGGGTTWNNAPQGWEVGKASAGSNYTGCEGYKGIGWNVAGALNTSGWSTFYVRATDEGDKFAWRKYDGAATRITVNFNTRPNPPAAMTTDPPLDPPCKWCGGVRYFGDKTIRLKGQLSDPDNDQLTAIWDVYGGPAKEHREGPTLGSGNTFSTVLDLSGRENQTVSWTLWGRDGPDGGDWKNGPGPFVVDLTGIPNEPGVTAGLYEQDNRWHGGVGVPGTFTFDPGDVNLKDVDHYMYDWATPPAKKVDADALGGKATVQIAPIADGVQTLYVQSVDRAGHESPIKEVPVHVRAGNGPLGQWPMEGNAKDTAFLGDRHGTLSGGATYAGGAVGTGLRLDGTGQMTAPTVVKTDASFSVSAWVKLDNVDDRWINAVGQMGVNQSAFVLQYAGDRKRWVFSMPRTDEKTPTEWDFVTAPAAPMAGQWTQLTGVYDAYGKKVRFYVDGELVGAVARPTPWNGTGEFYAGRGLVGSVDEVKVYDRALTDGEVRGAVSRDNVQAGYWSLDETAGTTARNAAGGEMGVLRGGARFVEGGAVNGAVQLDNPGDYVTTSGPVLRTDRSFSVSAWAWADRAPGGSDAATVVSQDGAVTSGFMINYRSDKDGDMWELAVSSDSMVRSARIAKTGEWTHLTAVYDTGLNQIRVYVNGTLAGSAPRTTGVDATGPFLLGQGRWQGNVTNPWRGGIDEVRAYNRVLSADEIRGLVSRDGVMTGNWKFDGNTQDSSPKAIHATAINGPDYTGGQASMPDPNDLALRLDGSAKWVQAPHAVDTDRSFSVAAWARVDKLGSLPAVLSQDGNQVSAFKVRARSDGRWGFVMFAGDVVDDGTKRDEAVGDAIQLGQWTHLVAVYDAGAHQIQLYVNGVLAGSAAHTQTWNATGGFQIGRAKWAGGPVEYFTGAIDDVAAYSRALFASEIQAMAGRDLALVHNYALDESGGRNAADGVGARGATVTGGASFAPGRVGNAITLDGTSGAAVTSGVDVRLDQSFTVSAWVKLRQKDCDLDAVPACKVDAVTADGEHTSKFRLGHIVDADNNAYGAWLFEMPESDAAGARVTKAAVSTEPTDLDTWTHLVAVYDQPTKKIWLYVNGDRVGDGTLNTPWPAAKGLAIGRGKVKDAAGEYWPGSVDDVRLYTGPLDSDRILGLFHSYPAQAASALPEADAAWWKFDDNAGTSAADSSGRGRTATLKGGATWIGGRNTYSSWLDGTSGYAQTASAVLDTTHSFSATAWVYLTQAGTANTAVLAQDAGRLSAFSLGYNGTTKTWMVLAPQVDKDNPGTAVNILNSTETAAAGAWTHLAMAYDADLHQLRLYVNGLLSATKVGVTVLPSSGPMSIGRARWNGANSAFFPRGIDDVRVYARALGDGEIRKVHDDTPEDWWGFYRFDKGNGVDTSWRKADAAIVAGSNFGVPAVSGQALQLDGASGGATAPFGLQMLDSFTVSGWARLTRGDLVATVVSQDGDRASGYALQYRPDLKRWVFGAAISDSDGAPQAYAAAPEQAVLNQWTHLTGVYDFPARQLRLYVDGELAGVRDRVVLWRATGKVAIGRAKADGKPSGWFAGALDDVRISDGIVPDAEQAARGGWAGPPAGQIGRFLNGSGDHYTGPTGQVRDGYHFEGTLGTAAAEGPNTRMLYACRAGADGFTSVQADCEGAEKAGDVGLVYTQQPENIPTIAVYRCASGADRFESRVDTCEGGTNQGLLGYTVAYGTLTRYVLPGFDSTSTTDGPPPSYGYPGAQGLLLLAADPATQRLLSCQDGIDQFLSTDAACEGKSVLASVGRIWPEAPPGLDSRPIYRCRINTDTFVSLDAACEGQVVDKQLGYVLTSVPAVTAVFAA